MKSGLLNPKLLVSPKVVMSSLLTENNYAGFEVLTRVDMKSSVFWDIMLCSPVKVTALHGVMSQKIELF
jgi:hypothetical protein